MTGPFKTSTKVNELLDLRGPSRRDLLAGFGALALGSLLAEEAGAALQSSALAGLPHFAPRAKRVVYLYMAGAPSQIDLFDPKPLLVERNGEPAPESLVRGERFAFLKPSSKLLGSPHSFARHGECGADVSELLPHFASIVDKVAIVRSMRTEQFNHAPAQIFTQTGHARIGRPSFGAWVSYGLGSSNRDLPTFVVMNSGQYAPDGGASMWGPGFLPPEHQGVKLRTAEEGVPFLANPAGVSREQRRRELDALAALNRARAERCGDPEVLARIAQYEMAFRMQSSVPELMDLSRETPEMLEFYGAKPGETSFANHCLLARRMLESGVRFVQLYHWGWDSHGTGTNNDLVESLPQLCRDTDRASTALVLDLERRGLLDDTLVIWGGEFGRTPMNEERDGSKYLGRDHHARAFTMWLAGGGVKRGLTYGATDEFGFHIVENPVEINDLHATLLHLLGIDHERFTYRSQGRDFRLTDVAGRVVRELLA